MDSEERFLRRLREYDERAFNELCELYQQRVFHLSFRMLGRRDEAEELTQDVFVQVFKSIASFRGDSKLGTWIYRITVNLCKNRIKYLARRHENAKQELEPLAERAPLQGAKGVTFAEVARPDDMAQGRQMEVLVQRAIANIEPDFREVLILREIEGLSYDEIAEVTGVAVGTVKSRIHRARTMLKSAIEKLAGDKLS